MNILTNIDNIKEELILIYNIFREHLEDALLPDEVEVNVKNDEDKIEVSILSEGKFLFKDLYTYQLNNNEHMIKYVKRFTKISLYKFLSKRTGYNAPWGALTGIRPTKIYYEFLKKNYSSEEIKYKICNEFFVSEQKFNLLKAIVKEQEKVKLDYRTIDLYINIPFCTSKCYYCSFISLPIDKCRDLIDPYIDALLKEIILTLQFVHDTGLMINTVYIGGGTPTSIGVKNSERILQILPPNLKELTVEAGRPDTIDEPMLKMLYDNKVTRISVNPQTFDNDTLRLIGRNHSSEDIIDVYNMARQYPFVINMDLIAGLGNENFEIFKHNIDKTLELAPDNITVHTLSIKRASDLHDVGGYVSKTTEVEKMIEYSNKVLIENGYAPYYLYRQKNMLGNLENIGYSKKNKLCEFNVNSMEETLSVIACGANSISKKIEYDINRITRHANVKNIQEYITRIDEMITKKLSLFRNI